jgi:hypothetical protein
MIALLLFSLLSIAYGDTVESVNDHYAYRELVAWLDAVSGALTFGGASYTVDVNGDIENGGGVNAALNALAFQWHPRGGAMGATGFAASASFDYTPTPDGNGSYVYAFKAAWAQFVANWISIFLFKNKDNNPGFQYTLGKNCWDCVDPNIDCVVPYSGINIKDDLYWSDIAITKQSCPTDAGYKNCTIYTLQSSGTYLGSETMILTMKCANQKVMIRPTLASSGSPVSPDYCKIAVEIKYPYLLKSQTAAKADSGIGMTVSLAGKVGAAGITTGVFNGNGNNAVVFAAGGSTDYCALWTWDGTGNLDGVEKAIYLNAISGQSILDYDCTANKCDIVTVAVFIVWKIIIGIYTAYGWTTQIYLVSWDKVNVDYVYYDPTAGIASNSDVTSAAGFLAPTFISFFVVALLFLFHRK